MIVCSLNEIEVYSRRAYRGVGVASGTTWGLAEEAGKSARCLASLVLINTSSADMPLHNLQNTLQNTLQPLLSLLANIDGIAYDSLRPHSTSDSVWRVAKSSAQNSQSNNHLCPIITGCAISDLAPSLAARTIVLESLFSPLLLLPFLLRASRSHGLIFEVSWQKVTQGVVTQGLVTIAIKDGSLAKLDASNEALLCDLAQKVKVTIQEQEKTNAEKESSERDASIGSVESVGSIEPIGSITQAGKSRGSPVREQDWQELQAYAARIYVPASEESRLRGAGAIEDEN